MRLYDRMTRRGVSSVRGWEGATPAFRATLDRAVVLAADNVTRHEWERQADWRDIREDVPLAVPPWPVAWVETTAPPFVMCREHRALHRWSSPMRAWGLLIETVDCWAGAHDDEDRAARAAARLRAVAAEFFGGAADFRRWPDLPARWVATFVLAAEDAEGPYVPAAIGALAIGADGAPLGMDVGGVDDVAMPTTFPPLGPTPDLDGDALAFAAHLHGMVRSLWVALSFANCRNVRLVEDGGRWPSRQARRLAERTGAEPPARFYTLQIEPVRAKRADERDVAAAPDPGRATALHICRGHFAHYGEDKPLFGKRAGTFWVPAHVRGTEQAGIIGKDYAVKAPKDAA